MIKQFINLEWKAAARSANFGKSLAIKIAMGFFGLWILGSFLITGLLLYFGLKKTFPDQDPFEIVNNYIFYWILCDLVLRFFFQKLPVMTVKPLLILPVQRGKVVNYVLGKSALSFFNFLPLFTAVPFSITLIVKGYPVTSVLFWLLAVIIFTFIINFLNFIIESFSAQRELSFLPIILLVGSFFALNYFELLSLSDWTGKAFTVMSENPIFILIPIVILVGLYLFNYKLLYQKLFLDSGLKTKEEKISISDYNWTKNFGETAPFLQLDLKLILRNKRTKSSVFILLIGLFYGVFFYPQDQYQNMPWFFMFIGVFSTGIFLINFGQFIPAWDSGYYKFLMSQNIKYEEYLKSKFMLMAVSVIVLFVLGIPYVFFGWEILLAHFAAAIYNIGVNSHVMLLGGSYNRKKIDLNQKAAFNYQGTGAVQWLIGIPLLLIPMAIFAVFYFLISFEIACLALIVLGVLGMIFHQNLMKRITAKYLQSKYKMIEAFNQNN